MIVQPSFDQHISCYDQDLKTALYFMISMSTVLEEMTQDLVESTTLYGTIYVYYPRYEDKIKRHEKTYDKVFQAFLDEIFGEYNNRVSRRYFMANMGSEGWKYFDFYSLNGLFVTKFNQLDDEDKGEIVLEMFEAGLVDLLGNPQTRSTLRQTF